MPDDRSDADPYARISAGDAHRFLFERVADDTRCRVYDLDGRLVATLVGYLYGDGLPDAFDFTVTNPPVLPAGAVPRPDPQQDSHAVPVPIPEGYDALANAKWGAVTQSLARTLTLSEPPTTSPEFGHQRERPFTHRHVHAHRSRILTVHDHAHGHGDYRDRGGDHHPLTDPEPWAP
jgi:hypothetical protein